MRCLQATAPLQTADLGKLSVNKLYVQRRQGGRALSKTGDKYQRLVMMMLVKEWAMLAACDPQSAYALELVFFLPRVYTKGYPKKAKNKYVAIDAYNFGKFFQDCVAKVSGVDDANHLDVIIRKREDRENPRVEITLQEIEDV